jgi:hypothetical protein
MPSYQPSAPESKGIERPDIISTIARILNHHATKGRRKPKMFPSDVNEAARFWVSHQRAPDDYTEAMTEIRKNGELVGYHAPYHDRVVKTLRVFLGLKEIHQVFVIDCIDKGMDYRGEDMVMYTEIAKQFEIMWKDPEKYKADASKHLRMWQ